MLKKCKKDDDILFINASEHYEKKKKQNSLREGDIEKIVHTYKNRLEEDRYSRRVSLDEIEENDYNLNISRYISTIEVEKEIDLNKVHKELAEVGKDILKYTNEHNEYLKELGLNSL